MQSLKWINTEHTAIAVEMSDSYTVIVEPTSENWLEVSSRDDIALYVPHVPTPEELAAAIRAERDRRIAATDWTQLPDVPEETRQLWADYRQALRDVPQQATFPDSVEWPEKPTNPTED